MSKHGNYQYHSALAPYIVGHINEMRAMGYKANEKAYQLSRLDNYWIQHNYEDAHITAERISDWLCQISPSEGRSGQCARVGALKSLAKYMNALGVNTYVPLMPMKAKSDNHNIIHILSDNEIHELFHNIDTYLPKTVRSDYLRMANEYPIIYRLYLCCGMRNDEVCSMRASNANLETGVLTILDGKGHTDRLVYLPEDLRCLMLKYIRYMKKALGYEPVWLFPGQNPEKHIDNSSIDRRFRECWDATEASKYCEKRPTPHCLRHTFVVKRINQWAQEGLDFDVMMPYLSKYLGHKSPDETYYYYHLVAQAFQTIRQKDTMASKVIPKVRRR